MSVSELQRHDFTVSLTKARQEIRGLSDRRLREAIVFYSSHERNAAEVNAGDDADYYRQLLNAAWDEVAYRRKEKRRRLARAEA
jgi:hypothetical protein